MVPPQPRSTLFPYTTLFRSVAGERGLRDVAIARTARDLFALALAGARRLHSRFVDGHEDRKSTRLNSSHLGISYAVFCLKKKKTPIQRTRVRENAAEIYHSY